MAVFYGRFKHGRKWSEHWHRVEARSKEEVVGKMLKGTRYTASQIQVTTHNPN